MVQFLEEKCKDKFTASHLVRPIIFPYLCDPYAAIWDNILNLNIEPPKVLSWYKLATVIVRVKR